MSPMKKQPETECGCPRYEKARKFINHSLACLVARRGKRSIAAYYGSGDTPRPMARRRFEARS